MSIEFNNRYLNLGDRFYEKIEPVPITSPSLIKYNQALATELGLIIEEESCLADIFSGNVVHENSEPLAMAYAGHQFGHFNPGLGDGRAIYLGELMHADGHARDIQLKGSGRTKFSRAGDGRSALGPVLREYLVSEAMYKLGVPTTRALAAVLSGEKVIRETVKPGAVFTRVASSFIRVGSFQYFAMQQDIPSIKALADYVIERNYPELAYAENPYLGLLEAVVLRQARLIAQWMQLGFIHGVMNTDNMSVAGETIDYGPCAFMDHYDHHKVYSSIDHHGRYAYSNQPDIGIWNLTRLAECLVPLLDEDEDTAVENAEAVLQKYVGAYNDAWLSGFRAKCGITAVDGAADDTDRGLLMGLLNVMADNEADFTLCFYYLSQLGSKVSAADDALRALFAKPEAIDDWLLRWRERLSLETVSDAERQASMQAVNPVYIPRNHQVEKAIRAAEDNNDFSVFHALYDVLQTPYEYQPDKDDYMQPPEPHEVVQQTFCGT